MKFCGQASGVYARVGLAGFLAFSVFLATGFLAATPFRSVVVFFVLEAFPAVDFLAEGFLSAAAGGNEVLGVPVRNVRRVWGDTTLVVVETRARVIPRTADDVPRCDTIRGASRKNMAWTRF